MAVLINNPIKADALRAELYQATGTLTVQIAAMQEALCTIFGEVVNPEYHHIGWSIWHSSKSDYAQREMLVATLCLLNSSNRLVRWTFDERINAKVHKEFDYCIKKINDVASKRNDLVHSLIVVTYSEDAPTGELKPYVWTGSITAKRIEKLDIISTCKSCVKILDNIHLYLVQLHSFAEGETKKFPEKPQTPSLR